VNVFDAGPPDTWFNTWNVLGYNMTLEENGHRRSLVARPVSCGIALPSTLSLFPSEAAGAPTFRFQTLQTSMKYEARAGAIVPTGRLPDTYGIPCMACSSAKAQHLRSRSLSRSPCLRTNPAPGQARVRFQCGDLEGACVGLSLMVLLCLPGVGEGK
jgi:hypothetical protein